MHKDDATWLNISYLAFGILCAFFSYKALEMAGVQFSWLEVYEWYTPVATLAAVVLGVLFTWLLRRDPARHEYFLAAIGELRKVSWPSWSDTKRMTLIVVVVVGIFAVIVSVFDVIWARTLRLLIA